MSKRNLLRNRNLCAFLAAETISAVGMQMTWLALPWFVLTTTGSPARTSLVIAVELAPAALFGIASGSVIARVGARATMVGSDAIRTVLVAAVPTLHLLDLLSFPLLLLIVFLIGIFFAPYASAQRVIIPEIVGEDEARVGEAMSLYQGATSTASFLGPPIAGVLIGVLGATSVLYVNSATYFVAFILVALFVSPSERVPATAESRGLLAGLRFIARDRLLRIWTPAITGMNIVWSAFAIILPVLVLRRYGEHPEILGWLFAAFGFGAILGSALSFRVVSRFEHRLLGAIAASAGAVPLWLLLPDFEPAVAAVGMFLSGLSFPLINTAVITTRTMRTPIGLRPKVHTVAVTGAIVLSPLGALAAGPALESFSLTAVLAAALALNTFFMVVLAAAGLWDRAAAPVLAESQATAAS